VCEVKTPKFPIWDSIYSLNPTAGLAEIVGKLDEATAVWLVAGTFR
jgi:hypothetical protein